MSKSPSRRFPVTVTYLPVTRCQLCHRAAACRPGALSQTLTGHYRRAHPGALDPGVPVTGPAAIRTVTAGDQVVVLPGCAAAAGRARAGRRVPAAHHGESAGPRAAGREMPASCRPAAPVTARQRATGELMASLPGPAGQPPGRRARLRAR